MAENKKDIIKSSQLYFQEGKWDKAILEYKKLLALDPTDYGTHNMLGDAYKKKGEDGSAYTEYMTAAEAYAKQGMADKAQMLFKKIAMLDSGKLINEADRQKQILIKKNVIAEKLIEEGKADEAITTYREILQINPAQFDVYQKLGELYFQKGDKEEAMVHYKKIVEVYYKNKLFKKALPIYQKMMEMDADNIGIREKIAEIFERENNEQDAKREYLSLVQYYWDHKDIEKTDFYANKAVAFKSIEAKFFKGAALYMKKEYAEAMKELDMLLKFKANHQQALQLMASINIETGKDDEAMKFLDRLFKADPESAMANETMAELHFKKNENKEAYAKLISAAVLYMKKQEYLKAAMAVEKITSKDPLNTEAFEKLAEIHRNAGKKKEGADAYLKISEIFKKKGEEPKAEEYFKLARDLFPSHPAVLERSKKISADTPPPAPSPVSFMSAAKPAAPAVPKAAEPVVQKNTVPKLPEPVVQKPAAPKLPETAAPKSTVPAQGNAPLAPPPAPAPTSKITDNFVPSASMIKAAAAAPQAPADLKPAEKPPATAAKPQELPDIELIEPKPSVVKPAERQGPPPGKLNITSTLDQIMAGPRETIKPPPVKVSSDSAREDVQSLVAMADNYMKSGSFDEAIEMYQKASALDPHNSSIKEKLTKAYSQFAGTGLSEITEQEEAKKVAELKKRAEEDAKNKAAADARKKEEDSKLREFEEARKKADDEKKKADEETAKKNAEASKKSDEEAKKKMEEESKKKAEEESKRRAEEQKRKEETEKKKKTDEEEAVEIEISDDFATVTTAEIFMAQGLYSEADKILTKILKKEPANIEAKMMLKKIKDMEQETETTGHNVKDDEEPPPAGGKHSKVSYI